MKIQMIIELALLCFVPGCNTRIGSPMEYGQHGCLPVVGFLIICLFILVAFSASVGKRNPTSYRIGIVIWLLTGLVLQALPHTAGGIQVIPLPPWSYTGWIARIISTACWLMFVIGILDSLSPVKEHWKGAAEAFVVAVGLNAAAVRYWSSRSDPHRAIHANFMLSRTDRALGGNSQ